MWRLSPEWLFLAMAIWIIKALRNNQQWKKIALYLLVSTALAFVVIKTLFVINIEMVHFPQYAFCAILIFPLVKRYQASLILTTLAGAIDEAYQYFYLAPNETGYYDFNDVITNLIGATFGLILLKSFNVSNAVAPSFFNRLEIRVLAIFLFIVSLLFLFNILGVHIDDGAMFPIIKKELDGFWSNVPPNVTYHVIRPLPGLISVILLWLFYWKLGRE